MKAIQALYWIVREDITLRKCHSLKELMGRVHVDLSSLALGSIRYDSEGILSELLEALSDVVHEEPSKLINQSTFVNQPIHICRCNCGRVNQRDKWRGNSIPTSAQFKMVRSPQDLVLRKLCQTKQLDELSQAVIVLMPRTWCQLGPNASGDKWFSQLDRASLWCHCQIEGHPSKTTPCPLSCPH